MEKPSFFENSEATERFGGLSAHRVRTAIASGRSHGRVAERDGSERREVPEGNIALGAAPKAFARRVRAALLTVHGVFPDHPRGRKVPQGGR
jgi:hypothetical protein